MKIVESSGPFHYEIMGDREEEAAAEFEKRLDFLDRSLHLPREYYYMELSELRQRIVKEYGVTIK